jgi:hypothetical protein
LSDFKKLKFSGQIVEKYSNIKYNENKSSGSEGVPSGQTNGRTDITKLIVAFCNFVKAPKSYFWLTIATARG